MKFDGVVLVACDWKRQCAFFRFSCLTLSPLSSSSLRLRVVSRLQNSATAFERACRFARSSRIMILLLELQTSTLTRSFANGNARLSVIVGLLLVDANSLHIFKNGAADSSTNPVSFYFIVLTFSVCRMLYQSEFLNF